MMCNSNSYSGHGGQVAAEDPVVRSLPWLFRVRVPGFDGGRAA